ncbi:RNA-directed DNA polymerase, eukaryota, reverse transcriptase zinc-binding domain protein [Tanacetum coccineum]
MASYRTKKDDVSKISTSVFITNFPESCSAKELFQLCKQYGHVVDTFIPTKRSKTERRFHRTPLNDKKSMPKKAGGVKKDTEVNEVGNSYVHMVKGQMQSGTKESEATPALVLSDECLLSKDLSKSLFGRVKQFISLANIRKEVSNEGFVDIKIQYMGELWVLVEFVSEDSMKIAWVEVEGIPFKLWSDNTFKRIATKWGELLDIDDQEEMCFHSKRLCIYTKLEKNIFEEFKIIFRGKAFWIRAKEAPGWVPDFMEENDDEEQNDDDSKEGGFKVYESGSCGGDSDVEGVLETIFKESGQKENNLDEEHMDKQEHHSEDPFSIYKLLKKKKDTAEKENNSEHSLKYPPGFTPKEGTDVVGMHAEESRSDNIVNLSDHNAEEVNNNCPNTNSKEDVSNSVCSGHFKKSVFPRTGGSILSLMDELVKVGQVMGYKMDGCLAQKAKKDWVKELCVKNKVNFLALQETKMENMELFNVKMCWGNFVFDYVYSDSVEALEAIINKGDGNVEVVNKIMEVVNSLQEIDKIHSSEMAQKAKVELESDVSNEEIKRANFFTYGVIPKGCNSSFIALIPKILDANMVKDFRPISLIGSLYKIIAKILANRLVGVLGDIVNEVQSAFIAERQILDGPFILNGVLQGCKMKKKQSLIFKVDFEKAYDSVRPTKEFQFFKGLKQGDPLSPFLFILIMESLHFSFQRVVDIGMFNGIKLSSSLSISHMFYANDVVFVGQWCDGNITTLVHVLECFYRASGLRINMSKSKIMGVLVDSDKVKCVVSKLGCLILKTPFSYLGSKVGGSMSRVHAWNEVVDRVKNRLSKWKMKTLSIGGRLTLLKSVLGSMPIFHMSIFRVPLTVLRTLESIRSHFFKGQDINSKKASWVNWEKVLAPKEKGGLGVSSLYALNRGDSWDDGKVGGYVKAGAKSCWLSIVNEINTLKNKGINLLDFMHVKLGNGDITAFWEDIWIEGKALKNRYPRIYSLETCKLITVGMKLAQPSLDSSFRRVPRGGVKQEQFDELSALVHDVTLNHMLDRWIWALESSGEFFVASVRKVIDDKSLPEVDSKTRWIKYVPIKVNVHAWKVKIDSLPTRFNVSHRGIHIDSIMCAICDNGAETSSHLFSHVVWLDKLFT